MKTHVWNLTPAFPGKVNFIDTNNVVLGYDLRQCCCENAYWTISRDKEGNDVLHRGDDGEPFEIELPGYCFDPGFYERLDGGADYDETNVAVFKLVEEICWLGPDLPDLYIRLVNCHNGYYSHGFIFRGDTIVEDSL